MLNEFWIMLDLSFDLLLQAIDLFADGLYGRIVYQLRLFGEENGVYVQRPSRIPDRGQQLRREAEVGSWRPGAH